MFVSFLKSLSGSFGYDPIQNTPTFDVRLGDIQQPEFTLREIFQYLEAVDKRCLIVIDEFQQITRYPEKNVEETLRTHIQKLSNANFVFSGSRRRLMEGMTCDVAMVSQLIENYIKENDSHLREQLSFITEAQKELLYAVHAEGQVQSITSSAFNKKHRLRSPSSTQSAALKLLEYDQITRKEKTYSISDPLLSLWLNRRK